jgi:DNA polymerase-3 subunit beta
MTLTTTTNGAAVAFDAAELKAALARLKPLISSKGYSSPVLNSVRIDFDGETATLTTTDLDNTLRIRLRAPALDTGSFLVPFTRLAKVLSAHTKGTVTLQSDGTDVTIRCDRSTSKTKALPLEEFPRIREIEGRKISLNLSALADVLPAVSKDDSRPILCSVFVNNGEYVGTDSYRMYVTDTGDKSTGEFLVLRDAVELATKGRTGVRDAIVGDREMQVELDENTTLFARLVDGEFPPYRNLIPQRDAVVFEFGPTMPTDLKQLLKLGAGASGAPLMVRPHADGVEISCKSNDENIDSTVCDGTMALDVIGLNPVYLAALVDGMSNLRFYGVDNLKPVLLRDAPDHLGEGVTRARLIMPVRVV